MCLHRAHPDYTCCIADTHGCVGLFSYVLLTSVSVASDPDPPAKDRFAWDVASLFPRAALIAARRSKPPSHHASEGTRTSHRSIVCTESSSLPVLPTAP